MKTTPLQHEIDIAILENDLDALTELLVLYENEDDVRYLLYEAIDIVTKNLNLPTRVRHLQPGLTQPGARDGLTT